MKNILSIFSTITFSFFFQLSATTPDFIEDQTHLFDANLIYANTDIGLGILTVWSLPGGKGQDVQIVVIERDWNLYHEDLPSIQRIFGQPSGELDNINHGTANLGLLVGLDNNLGIVGICPEATVMVSSRFQPGPDDNCAHDARIAQAIVEATAHTVEGDIILIEVQAGRLNGEFLYPAEYCELTRDAIYDAIAAGRVVIEVAGNKNLDIDDKLTHGATNAVIVGSSKADQLLKHPSSNFGNRVDVYAWGERVVSAGYGDKYGNHTPYFLNDDYTATYDGTSSAAALVAGAAACLQAIYKAHTSGSCLSSLHMRNILRSIEGFNIPGHAGKRLYLPEAINRMKEIHQLDNVPTFITLNIEQYDAYGFPFGDIKHYKLERYFEHFTPYSFNFPLESEQVLRTLQTFIPETYQKFNEWINLSAENHLRFTVNSGQTQYISNFKETSSAGFYVNLIHGGENAYLQLKDPWYMDTSNPAYYDPPYGYRSLGENAIFEDIPDGFQLTPQSDHLGIFLNQFHATTREITFTIHKAPHSIKYLK